MILLIFVFAALLLSGCCPGLNMNHSRMYTAMDFMKYSCSESCILSKLDSYTENPWGYNGVINITDSIILEFEEDTLSYFHFEHHADGEKSRELFNFYVSRMKNERDYIYIRPNSFSVDYYNWTLHVSLTEYAVSARAQRF